MLFAYEYFFEYAFWYITKRNMKTLIQQSMRLYSPYFFIIQSYLILSIYAPVFNIQVYNTLRH